MSNSLSSAAVAVAGVILALITALGLPALLDSGAATSKQPVVPYGTR